MKWPLKMTKELLKASVNYMDSEFKNEYFDTGTAYPHQRIISIISPDNGELIWGFFNVEVD